MATTAVQSSTLNQVLDAVATVLAFGNGQVAGCGVNEQYITEAYSAFRPRSGEPAEITYGLVAEEPVAYSGAGRLAFNTYLTLEVTLFIRYEVDPAGSDQAWSRDLQWGGLVLRQKVNDILNCNFLHASYNPTTHFPDGAILTVEPLQQLPSPRPTKPDNETTGGSEDTGGYGEFKLYYSMRCIQPLTTS